MLLRRLSALLLGSLSLTGLLGVGEARAQECSSALSPCFDANDLDLPVAPTRFAAVEDASAQLAPGRLSFGLGFSYLREPVVVTAPSPDPEGRRVPLVSDLWQADLLIAVGLLEELHLGIGLPLRPAQEGGGADAVTSRVGGTLRGSAVADPRVILGWRVLPRGPVVGRLQLKVKLPLGDEGAFAGTSGLTAAPSFVATSNEWGPWHVAAELGATFRSTTRFGDVRLGNQLRFALGVRYSLFRLLSVGVEGWLAPTLLEQPLTPWGRARHVPAEWHASVGSPLTERLWVQLGAGTGLPLSSQGAIDDDGRDHFVGVGTPAWRALALIRVTE